LFVALGGAGIAANGQALILGQVRGDGEHGDAEDGSDREHQRPVAAGHEHEYRGGGCAA